MKMGKIPALMTALAIAGQFAIGDDLPDVAPAVSAQNPASQEPSTDDDVAPPRDPFWPIGYKQPIKPGSSSTQITGSDDKWQLARAKLRIGAITRSATRHLVLINGNTCQEGDVLAVEMDGYVYRFQIKKVLMERVEILKLEVRAGPSPKK